MADRLTFATLRRANLARLPTFKNPHGEPAHSEPDGSDWSLADWLTATAGELGELANLLKKVRRGDLTLDEARADLGRECADVVTYLDILAFRLGVDLGPAVVGKFNEVSRRVDSPVRIAADGCDVLDVRQGRDVAQPRRALAYIEEERQRQVAIERQSPVDDDRYTNGELCRAAATYALTAAGTNAPEGMWPWGPHSFKPKTRHADLVRAGALIVAELERLDRAAPSSPASPGEGAREAVEGASPVADQLQLAVKALRAVWAILPPDWLSAGPQSAAAWTSVRRALETLDPEHTPHG